MKITENISLVGSGQYGISDDEDCIVYLIDGGDALGLIDTGAGNTIEPILENIRKDGYQPENISSVILTHSHADHTGGARELRKTFDLEVIAPSGADKLIESGSDEQLGLGYAKRSGVYDEDYQYKHCKIDRSLTTGESFSLGVQTITAIKVPGHSPHSTCYLIESGSYTGLFTGDVVFFQGETGLLNAPGSDLKGYREYFDRLIDLDFDGLYPGHKVFVVHGGKQHIETAYEEIQGLTVPRSFFG